MASVLFFNLLPAAALAQVAPSHLVEPGDIINISVFPAEEFSREVTVQPDGSIEIPLLGSMKAAGSTADSLQKLLTARFSKYVSNPSITLNVRKFSVNRVAIIGQVTGTGYYEYREGMKLLDLLAACGGMADNARMSKTRIFRRQKAADGSVSEQVFHVDLEAVMAGKMDKNVPLQPGDVVYVPKRTLFAASKWISDNLLPWLTLAMFTVTIGIVTTRK